MSWGKRCYLEVPACIFSRSRHDLKECSEDIWILTPRSSEVLDAEGSSRHVPVGFSDGAAPKGIGCCKKVVTFLIYTVIHFSIILLYRFMQYIKLCIYMNINDIIDANYNANSDQPNCFPIRFGWRWAGHSTINPSMLLHFASSCKTDLKP